MTDRHTDIVIV